MQGRLITSGLSDTRPSSINSSLLRETYVSSMEIVNEQDLEVRKNVPNSIILKIDLSLNERVIHRN